MSLVPTKTNVHNETEIIIHKQKHIDSILDNVQLTCTRKTQYIRFCVTITFMELLILCYSLSWNNRQIHHDKHTNICTVMEPRWLQLSTVKGRAQKHSWISYPSCSTNVLVFLHWYQPLWLAFAIIRKRNLFTQNIIQEKGNNVGVQILVL